MELKRYNRAICHQVMEGSKWEALLHFTDDQVHEAHLVFGPKMDPDAILKFAKKCPDLVLLGAVMYGRILDKNQINRVAKMSGIEQQHAELSAILQMPLMRTTQLLGNPSQTLSQNLTQYIKDQAPAES